MHWDAVMQSRSAGEFELVGRAAVFEWSPLQTHLLHQLTFSSERAAKANIAP